MGIEFRHVVKRFENGTEALSDVSIAIPTGSMTFLTGHSGAGKTTFLNLLLRLDSPTRGSVLVNDVDIAGIKRRHLPVYRRHLGVVFQDGQLLDGRSIFDNVALPLHVAGRGHGTWRDAFGRRSGALTFSPRRGFVRRSSPQGNANGS